MGSFKDCTSLLSLSLDDLSIDLSGVLKSPAIIVLLSISPFKVVRSCLIYQYYSPQQQQQKEIVGLHSPLKIQCYCELWCSLQTQLRSGVAVALA